MGITDYLTSVGVPRNLAANWQWRIPLAQQYLGISNYTGTGTQNDALVKALQAAGYTYNGGGSSGGGSGSDHTVILQNQETYKGKEIRKTIYKYSTGYHVWCNCKNNPEVGYQEEDSAQSTEQAARNILNTYVSHAKAKIDAYVNSQNGGGNNGGGSSSGSVVFDQTAVYRGYDIDLTIEELSNGKYFATCSVPAIGWSSTATKSTQSAAVSWLAAILSTAKTKIGEYIDNQSGGGNSGGGNSDGGNSGGGNSGGGNSGGGNSGGGSSSGGSFPGGYSPNWADGDYGTNSVIDFLSSIGIPRSAVIPTQPLRGQIYEWLGLGSASSYTGSSSQNVNFLNALKAYGQGQGNNGGGNNGGGNSGGGNNGGNNGGGDNGGNNGGGNESIDWSSATVSTDTYKGHTIKLYLQYNRLYNARVTCSGSICNDDQSATGLPDQTTAVNWMRNKINEYKAIIDNGSGNEPENPDEPENPENPNGGDENIDWSAATTSTETYKGHTITLYLLKQGGLYYARVTCSGTICNDDQSKTGMPTQATAANWMRNKVNEYKATIDGGNGNPENPENPENPGNPNSDDYPWPEIVFGDAATPAGGAGPNYQQRRNQGIADMLFDQMDGQIYTTGNAAKMDFIDKLRAIVNAHGGNLQVTADGQITGPNATDWANTMGRIKQYLFNKFGYSSWNDFVTGGNGGGGGGGGGGGSYAPGFTTGSGAGDNTWNTVQTGTQNLYNWLSDWYNNSIGDWNGIKNSIGNYASEIEDRITTMNNTFNNVKGNMDAATELQQKAQRIYSNQNIEKMNQQLRQMGYNTVAAAPAVYYQATKQMANVAIEYYKLKAEEEASLAELETQRAQLIDNIKAAGIEADQWSKNMINEIEKQIQTVRDNFVKQASDILGKYTLQPMLDVMSEQIEIDAQNIANLYDSKFVAAHPEMAQAIGLRTYGSDWYYVDPSIAMNYNGYSDLYTYLVACAESIRRNKVNAERQIAAAGATTIVGSDNSNSGSTVPTVTQPVYFD